MPELISPLELLDDEPTNARDDPDDMLLSDLEHVRELVLRAHPDVVPELVSGDSIGALLASVEPAKLAYARLREGWAEGAPAPTHLPVQVPAGGGMPIVVDADRLPAAEKIRRGLASAVRRENT